MNIKEAKNEIINTVYAYLAKDENGMYKIPTVRQRPILLMGPPGIGKTQIMEQITRKCKIGLVSYTITHHTRQSAVGLPYITNEEYQGQTYSITRYTMSEIIASVYDKIESCHTKEGILFIDEINCVSETLAPTMLQFLQCKTFGNHKIPEGWIIIAAGNPPEYNKSVREFDMVTLDRVRTINIQADFNIWKEYAIEEHIHPAIISYLDIKPKSFYHAETDVDGLKYVTARGWEDLSNIIKIYEEMNLPVTYDIIFEFLHHEDIAEDFSAYLDLYHKYQEDYHIRDILVKEPDSEIYARLFRAPFDEKITVVHLLVDALKEHFSNVAFEERITDLWYEFLKQYKEKLDTLSANAITIYNDLITENEELTELKNKSGFLTKDELLINKTLFKLLKSIEFAGNDSDVYADRSLFFTQAKTNFDLQIKKLDNLKTICASCLEHAFDFMEGAFKDSEEMVIFVTELTLFKESALFLSTYNCRRYMEYSASLLLGDVKTALLKELN